MTDFVKLAKQMKLILHEHIYAGIQAPVVCGILIQGKAALCLSLQQFGLFPVVFTNIVDLKPWQRQYPWKQGYVRDNLAKKYLRRPRYLGCGPMLVFYTVWTRIDVDACRGRMELQ
ncbi:hypothetical protein DFQ28_001833 [Apophysomyces sp. BC1034]|nr:hypothetical protein DFQ30_009576 [Apophysomyces sp. BC1015]KAG0183279.1 hypothetical protein DFQ29_007825 [Apophysomyces sp. BC1021]KAG0194032.1 hypothetical protein DFQ28_001833 [Apophysomyces sp. BC1034]